MRKRSKHPPQQEPKPPDQPGDAPSTDPVESAQPTDDRVWEIEDVLEEDLFADDEAAEASHEDSLSIEEQRIAELEFQVDELKDKYQRSLADFQNYQRRALQNERNERQQGVRDVLQSLLGVLDHFELALAQDANAATAEQILSGVSAIKAEFLRVLQSKGVGLISPEPGEVFDPNQHEAVLNQFIEGVEPGCVASMLQAGYTINDRVVRPAKVAVTPHPVCDDPINGSTDEADDEPVADEIED
jgi:molecular chaperone GrpE